MIVVLEVYVLARRAAGPWLGALIALVVAFFGSGFENLFWALQIGFVGAIALGLGAMILLDGQPGRGRVVAAVALITIGMMTSGFGIFMFGLVGLDLLLDPRRRRLVLTLAVPAVIYLAWYLVFGRNGVATARDPFTIDAFLSVPAFVLDGVGTAIGSALGVGPLVGRLAALALVVVVVVRLDPRRPGVGAGGGLLRGDRLRVRHPRAAASTALRHGRRVQPLRLPVGDRRADRARQPGRAGLAPERGPRRMATVVGLASVTTLALIWNVWLLREGRDLFADRAAETRATIVVATGDLGPGVDPDTTKLLDRTVTRLREVLDEFGSPLTDSLAGDAVPPVDPARVAEIRANLGKSAVNP